MRQQTEQLKIMDIPEQATVEDVGVYGGLIAIGFVVAVLLVGLLFYKYTEVKDKWDK